MSKKPPRILKWPAVQKARAWARRTPFPGAREVTLYEVGKNFIKEIRAQKLSIVGAAVTYRFLMAIPPTLLFLFSLVPYLPLQHVEDNILTVLAFLTPNQNTYDSIAGTVTDFMRNERRDLLSIGVIATLFFSSNGMMGLMRVMDRSLLLYKKRNWLSRRWTAIKLTFLLIIVAILTLTALAVQSAAINDLLEEIFGTVLVVKLFSLLILVIVVFLSICMVYTYGPSLTHRFKFISPGSVFATVLCLLLTAVFFFLVNNVLHYNKVYGSIGTILAMMVWLYLLTQVILLGFMLNVATIAAKFAGREDEKKQPLVTP